MALPTSGTISLLGIGVEYDRPVPNGLYYLSGLAGVARPASLRDFYGLSNIPTGVLLPSTISNIDGASLSYLCDLLTSVSGWNLVKDPWIGLNKTTGSQDTTFTVYVSKNITGYFRSGTVELWKDSTKMDSITVNQPTYGIINPCLSPDTPITMADGTFKELGDLVLGEMVMSYKLPGLKDDESNLDDWTMTDDGFNDAYLVPSMVTNLVHGTYSYYFNINNMMRVTFEHHLFVCRDDVWSFIQAISVAIGDCFWDGENRILIETIEVVQESSPMITLDVEVTDVYFAHGVLVHNPLEKPLE